MAQLALSLTILDQIRQAQDEDEFPDQWMEQRGNPRLVTDVDGFVRMRGRLYVQDIPGHPALWEHILHVAHQSRFTMHPNSVKNVIPSKSPMF